MQRFKFAIPLLALAFAVPAHAQEVNQQRRQQADAIVSQYVEGLSKGDSQALMALYAPNPIDITPYGKNTSAAQIQSEAQMVHSRGLTLSAKADDVLPLAGGQVLVITAPYTASYSNNPSARSVQGNLLFVAERQSEGWKVRAVSASRQVPASPK